MALKKEKERVRARCERVDDIIFLIGLSEDRIYNDSEQSKSKDERSKDG